MPNLFNDLPVGKRSAEVFSDLLLYKNIKIEKIVSTGQVTSEEDVYVQDQAEWVVVLNGAATIWLEGRGDVVLGVGDYLFIAPKIKHRVTYTSTNPVTVWLAIHIFPDVEER